MSVRSSSVVGLHSIVPPDAFTADTLGMERAGNGVLIDDGLVLTVGYLITEAETVWLHLGDGHVSCRVMRSASIRRPVSDWCRRSEKSICRRSRSASRKPQTSANAWWSAAPAAAHARSPAASQPSRNSPAIGNMCWTRRSSPYPAHPNWGGTALISGTGKLIGIGSLQLERARGGKNEHLNMIVPIDLLNPILDDLRKFGRVNRPVRPWLGLYSTEIEDKVVVVGIAPKGPAARAEIKTGDVVVAVNGDRISTLAGIYRKVWMLGQAGVEMPLTLYRDGVTFDVRVNSSDRAKFLKGPRLH